MALGLSVPICTVESEDKQTQNRAWSGTCSLCATLSVLTNYLNSGENRYTLVRNEPKQENQSRSYDLCRSPVLSKAGGSLPGSVGQKKVHGDVAG